MRRARAWRHTIATAVLLLGSAGIARSEVVHVETDCAAAGFTLGVDCFQDIDALDDWLWNGGSPRNPSEANPVVVDVGIGTFSGGLQCPDSGDPGAPHGWVTLRGISRDRSKLVASQGFFMVTVSCDGIEFSDISMEAPFIGVYWQGSGDSTWTDVNLRGDYVAWYDSSCGGQSSEPFVGEHYWYSSKIEGGAVAYYADCGQTWIYGGELLTRPATSPFTPVLGGLGATSAGVKVSHRGDVRIFGAAVRVDATGFDEDVPIHGVVVGPGGNSEPIGSGTFHMHGGIVNVKGGALGHDVYGVRAEAFGLTGPERALAHTLETAFVVATGAGGAAHRAWGDGQLLSPLLWQSGTDEPVASLQSLTGHDLFVETDCDGTSCTGGDRSHLMIYDTRCTPSPWFDVVTGACRQP